VLRSAPADDAVYAAVLAVDVGSVGRATRITNGYQAIIRAVEICHRQHAHLRFTEADLVLRPRGGAGGTVADRAAFSTSLANDPAP
jgi:hypothetical protein